MKLKWFIAGAAGVFLLFAGQNVPAQESAIQGTVIPEPGEHDALPAPDYMPELPEYVPPPLPAVGAALQSILPSRSGSSQSAASTPAASTSASQSSTASQSSAARQSSAAGQTSTATQRKAVPEAGWFWGVTAGVVFPNYDLDDTEFKDWLSGSYDFKVEGRSSFNAGLFFGIDSGFLISQAEVLIRGDSAKMEIGTYSPSEYGMNGISLLVPLIFKLDFHLGPVVLQPLAGAYLNFALGMLDMDDKKDPYANPLFGLMFGGAVGLELGGGILFMDVRYAGDLGKTKAGNYPITIWSRSGTMLNVGYQFFIGGGK